MSLYYLKSYVCMYKYAPQMFGLPAKWKYMEIHRYIHMCVYVYDRVREKERQTARELAIATEERR